MSAFTSKLREATRAKDSLLCVGLDPDPSRIPEPLRGRGDWAYEFNKGLIEATSDLACAYKPNLAFYEALGPYGLDALARTVRALPHDSLSIGDAKRNDISNSAQGYARGMFEVLGFDSVTLNPYLGRDSLEPFLAYADRGAFILVKTSNPGSGDLQDLPCEGPWGKRPLYEVVALRAREWNTAGNVGLVVGATYPRQLANVRQLAPDLPLLIPGVGAQAGDLEQTVLGGTDEAGELAVINSSRQIIFASSGADWRDAARQAAGCLRDAINLYRRNKQG